MSSITDQISKLTDRQVLAYTAWGEARSLGEQGMTATLDTINNRHASGRTWWGSSLRGIALAHYQYSCWNVNDPNLPKMLAVDPKDQQLIIAYDLVDQLLAGTLADITSGADSYFDKRLPRWPVWYLGLNPCFSLGPHLYFNTISRSLANKA